MTKSLACIYARVSSAKQKDEETIDSQVECLANLAKQKNFEVPQEWIFKDEGYSGSSLERPGLDKLRDLVRENAMDYILVYSPDRLSRRYVNQLLLEEEILKYKIQLIYLKGCERDNTPEGNLLKHFQGIFAEYERTQILDRSRRGKLYKAQLGKKNIIPKAPYGYSRKRDESFYTILNEEALILKEIFHLYTREGYTLRSIAKHLEQKGVSSPNGSQKWCLTTIKGMLNNSAYIGVAYYGKTEKGEGDKDRIARYNKIGRVVKSKRPKKDKPIDQWFPIPVPAIIDQSEFDAAQIILKKNKDQASRNTKVPTVLQGLLVCGCCGRSYYKRMCGKKGKKKGTYYCHSKMSRRLKWCGNPSINQEILDDMVWKEIIRIVENPHLIENEIQRRIAENPKKKEIEGKEQEIEREIGRMKNAQDKIIDAYQETDCIDIKQLRDRLKNLNSREAELKKELEALRAINVMNEKHTNLKMTMEEFRRQLNENAKNMDVRKKQKILRNLIDEIVINNGEVTINHIIPLNFDRNSQLCTVNPF